MPAPTASQPDGEGIGGTLVDPPEPIPPAKPEQPMTAAMAWPLIKKQVA